MVCTHLNTTHAIGVVSRFLSNPIKDHQEAVKWVLRYLKGGSRTCLCFGGPRPILEGYAGANMIDDLDGKRSIGYMILMMNNKC